MPIVPPFAMSRLDPHFQRRLAERASGGLRRALRPLGPASPGHVSRDDRVLVNFSGNDYLGLSRHPVLIERAREMAALWGTGTGASRLVTGSLDLHKALEEKIARFKGTEAALIFNSGWQANATILPALLHDAGLDGPALVYTDRLIHASLHHGCAAAGVRQIRFHHNDLDHLSDLLAVKADQPGRRFIVTESVFSMDGDRADIEGLMAVADRFGAFVYLDEAHATGVLGAGGRGLATPETDLVMGTFSKAFGGFGAYVAGSRALCDFLINEASGFIYATALPPPVLGAIGAALDLMPDLDEPRRRLQANARRLRDGLAALGIDTGGSSTQIVPAILSEAERALDLSRHLEAAGMLASAIRPPTVPPGTSRIRFALSAAHTEAEIDGLAGAVAGWSR